MEDFFEGLGGDFTDLSDALSIPVDPVWRPESDFVLCRDLNGVATAVYGGQCWDFNPMRLSAYLVPKIRFNNFPSSDSPETAALVEEVRYLLFCLFFYVKSGRLGRLSVEGLYTYSRVLRYAVQFCLSQKGNPLVGGLSLSQLFSNPAYLSAYRLWMDSNKVHNQTRSYTRSLILHLAAIGEVRLGFALNGVFSEGFGAQKDIYNQHPIVPTRIYIGVINDLGDCLDLLHSHKDLLEGFLSCFQDLQYGWSEEYQIRRFEAQSFSLQPNLPEAIRSHGLDRLLTGDFQPLGIGGWAMANRSGVSAVLMRMQWILKYVIHLYTGMRDQEVMRLPYSCLDAEELSAPTTDETGRIFDSSMMVSIISTTTKFSGYRRSTAWLATECVVRAVEVAQAICRALSSIYKVDYEKMPLFLCPVVTFKESNIPKVSVFHEVEHRPDFVLKYTLQDDDLAELAASDPFRNFAEDERFQLGASWRFTSHQFRRSLAFYGSSSGFISLPSLRKQFKHLSIQMTRYYSNNFEKLKTIFGYYDEDKKEFVLPKNHFLFEYQTGVPLNIAYDLLDHAFGDGSVLFGGVGTYISNQREKNGAGEIHIADHRKETEQQAKEGKIAYRTTLLGGCTTVGKCDSYLLGNAVSCLSCDEGIIEKEKLEGAIADDEALLERLEPGTGEYQVVESELNGFKKFHQRFIPVKVVE